jgi:hypothetical protein
MKYVIEYLHTEDKLLSEVDEQVQEILQIIENQIWADEYSITSNGVQFAHQAAYNKSLAELFENKGWDQQPLLSDSPKLIGDFAKNRVFIEVQFGNSATLYRDFYKFQYGYQKKLIDLSVLIVPHNEYQFFPTRPGSVRNMANFTLALRYFTVLPISVPTIIIGLLADHEEAQQN